MAMGGMLCLFGVVLACKLREGNKAVAQDDKKPDAAAVTRHPQHPEVNLIARLPDPAPPVPQLPEPKGTPLPEPKAAPPLPDLPEPKGTPLPEIPAPMGTPQPEPKGVPIPTAPEPKGTPLPEPKGTPLPDLPEPKGGPMPEPKGIPLPDVSEPKGTPLPAVPEPARPMPSLSAPVEAAPPSSPPGGEPLPPLPDRNPAAQSPLPMPTGPRDEPPPSPKVEQAKSEQPGEPPLAPAPGPVEIYKVRRNGETMRGIARHTLNTSDRWNEVARLNPHLSADAVLPEGTVVRLPADACVQDEIEPVKPLPALRPKSAPAKPRVPQPLTGTFPCNLDDKRVLILPKAIREQLGEAETVLVSPGPDHCLWLTNQAHLDRLAEKIEQSPAKEIDIRVFKRLYFAQTEKAVLGADGRVTVSDRLAQFAGLSQEVVIVGIDDHFELWDAAKWKDYTQKKSAAARASMAEQE
jgi:division/cell wall cluster transcriptional repressor MraZ